VKTKEQKLERLDQEAARRKSLPKWEYKARNMQKVPGMALEGDFNKLGLKGGSSSPWLPAARRGTRSSSGRCRRLHFVVRILALG
jgi:hypothetical protein